MRITLSHGRQAVRAGPLLLLCLSGSLLAGCSMAAMQESKGIAPGAQFSPDDVQMLESSDVKVYADLPGILPTSFGADDVTASPATKPAPTAAAKRLMIYTGQFELLVPNVKDAVLRFMKQIEEVGGYLEKQENAKLVCRVPAGHFQAVVDALPTFGVLTRESIQARDVTKQFFDLKLRIETAEKARDRLLTLLEKAEKVEDILQIEKELRRLTEEIERFKGEFKFLSEQIALSTVEVLFRSNAPAPRPIRGRTYSRFSWINRVGVEHVLEAF